MNKNFYCSANKSLGSCLSGCGKCSCYHRKHPTPEQFEQEYGFKWEGAVYYFHSKIKGLCVTSLEDVSFIKTMKFDPIFAMGLMGIPFFVLKALSIDERKRVLDDLSAVFRKYSATANQKPNLLHNETATEDKRL